MFIKSNLNAYSLGEFAGLVIAGVLNLKDALIFVATRERLVLEKCKIESSGMAAVSLEPVKLQTLLESQREFFRLSIACCNSPTDCVVSGPLSQLTMLKANLDMKSIRYSQLSVPYGYHSLAMAPVIDDLRVLSRKIKTQAPSLPVISTVLGRVILPGDISSFNNDLFCSTLRRTCQINSRDLFIHFERGFVFPSNDMDRTWSSSMHFTHATKVSRSLRFNVS